MGTNATEQPCIAPLLLVVVPLVVFVGSGDGRLHRVLAS